jgi:hypothetical protein
VKAKVHQLTGRLPIYRRRLYRPFIITKASPAEVNGR